MMTRRTLTRTLGTFGAMGTLALAACLWLPATAAAAADESDDIGPAIGTPAPDFELSDTDGNAHTLAEHRAERPVVMVFFRGAW